MQNKNIKKYVILAVAIILIITGVVILVIRSKSQGNQLTNASMNQNELTSIVKSETFKDSISATGVVNLKDETSIYAQEAQLTIGKILVKEGDTVEEGQVVAEYDILDRKEELEKNIEKLELSLKTEKLSLQNLLLPKTEAEKLSLENNVIQAERSLIDAQNNLNNYEVNLNQKHQVTKDALKSLDDAKTIYEQNLALYEVGAVSENELSTSKYNVEKAQDTYNNSLKDLEEFSSTKQNLELSVKSAQNTLNQSKIELQNADNPLNSEVSKINYQKMLNSISSIEKDIQNYKKELQELPYYLYSTVTGTVTSIPVEEGSKTQDNTIILKVANLNNLIVKSSISEYDSPKISLGQKVEMTSDGIENKVYYGNIIKINHSATSDATSSDQGSTVSVEISVDNPDETLKPGYNLDLDILTINEENSIVINSTSILNEEGSNYVFVVKNNKVQKTPVELGTSSAGKVLILNGLSSGDEILNVVSSSIEDGMDITEVQNVGGEINDSNISIEKGIQSGGDTGRGPQGGGPRDW